MRYVLTLLVPSDARTSAILSNPSPRSNDKAVFMYISADCFEFNSYMPRRRISSAERKSYYIICSTPLIITPYPIDVVGIRSGRYSHIV